MRFVIEASPNEDAVAVWNDQRALPFLDRLIYRADEAAHDVVLLDADLLDDSEWFQSARQAAGDLLLELRELARASAWAAKRADGASSRVSTSAEAERALRVANSPLKVLVENSLRDGALLHVAVRLLASDTLRQLWVTPPVPPAIEMLHSGGAGDMPAFIAHEASNAQEADIPFRLIVVVDPDKKSLGELPSTSAEGVRQEALRLGAKPFVLTKHEAENYIPDFHWKTELKRDPRNPRWSNDMASLLSMTRDERDYCDMEKLGCKQVPAQYERNRPYHLEVLLRNVRKEQDQAVISAMAADLRARDHSDDLKAILELIDQER
jgi:hypothetical protein